ncbi:MAG: Preprotein translocase, SecE subunit [Candidatus Beckwithbacteria bacterium GW2011_GWB1_47_15]|uniref:Protein translocase subunit SecE n=1 Tax=Candidatus Beckwithbacteria bacterium GW2011_GWB1_47_15 TaxID=1618371 RepID=A0A0G1RWK3_9BACT|nr:MAG: Preprotein translocase subunit SecE, preprotein translocase subunit SecE [Candidatus Beckwithbacteria bacterium GW2011_GWC1_49_16]KKU35221.1 MAG: Preprotein translocase, SecE subunit [Candidatus Beckwithbacteria bacterium GW2011_GWA1_46_30]KKU61501.1 MAG: Preprotein translocase, SecE subunit [Candidatus Beckwithbacteria bacterium GW2011_GWB1_47_15]KKU71705.1 MAG: Preprotein translocase, SecE subunit [Candidatus Beckwithbacteria bacterium GW2011_GWA2_47_25]KKW03803.1 MAG: Preprotein tran
MVQSAPQRFVKESLTELKKVVWPTKNQVVKLTGIVIGVSAVTGALLGGLDYLFTKLVGLIVK